MFLLNIGICSLGALFNVYLFSATGGSSVIIQPVCYHAGYLGAISQVQKV